MTGHWQRSLHLLAVDRRGRRVPSQPLLKRDRAVSVGLRRVDFFIAAAKTCVIQSQKLISVQLGSPWRMSDKSGHSTTDRDGIIYCLVNIDRKSGPYLAQSVLIWQRSPLRPCSSDRDSHVDGIYPLTTEYRQFRKILQPGPQGLNSAPPWISRGETCEMNFPWRG
jgi:hypothetical protein